MWGTGAARTVAHRVSQLEQVIRAFTLGGGGIHGIGQGQGTDPVINTLRTRGARFMQVEEGAANMEKEKTE